jgi:hypothetical protein
MRRRRMSSRKSKRLFKKTANRIHRRNIIKKVPRGGIRV